MPFRLNPLQQRELLADLTAELTRALPGQGWKRLVMEYRQIGSHGHGGAVLVQPDDETAHWNAPDGCWRYLHTLRDGMYVEDKGTWLSVRYTLDHPDAFKATYNYEIPPEWGDPAPREFRRELERYPRSTENIPDWFRRRLAEAVTE